MFDFSDIVARSTLFPIYGACMCMILIGSVLASSRLPQQMSRSSPSRQLAAGFATECCALQMSGFFLSKDQFHVKVQRKKLKYGFHSNTKHPWKS